MPYAFVVVAASLWYGALAAPHLWQPLSVHTYGSDRTWNRGVTLDLYSACSVGLQWGADGRGWLAGCR